MIKLKDLITEGKLQQAHREWKFLERTLTPYKKKFIKKHLNSMKSKWKYFTSQDYSDYIDGELDIKIPPQEFEGNKKAIAFGQLVSAYAGAIKEPNYYKFDEGKLKEEILKGGVVSGGGSEAALDVIRAMTRGNNLRVGELSNMTNWLGQYKDGVEFGLKRKMKVGGKVVSIVQIKKTGKDKFTIAYLDWDDGKRPLLTRKILKNVSAKNLPKELKKSVKVG